jgi:hypothetical protein
MENTEEQKDKGIKQSFLQRKDAVPIEVKQDVAMQIKQRLLLNKMSKIEQFLWPGKWFVNVWDGIICLCGVYLSTF